MNKIAHIIHRIFLFYYDGFRNMTIGKKLWTIILIKLFIIFIVMRFFFFPDYLNSRCATDSQKSDFVMEQLLINNSK